MQMLFDQFLSGGPIMWPILFCSIVTWAIIIERAIHLRQRRFIDEDELEPVLKALDAGELETAEREAGNGKSLAAAIIAQGIDEFRFLAADLETALTGAAERRLKQVWDHMIILNTGGRVAILLGLLGTVVGMVGGFRTLTAAGVDKQQVAAAISVALITTVGGMVVAIPAVIGEALLRAKIRKITDETEEVLMATLKAAAKGGVSREALPAAVEKAAAAPTSPTALAERVDKVVQEAL